MSSERISSSSLLPWIAAARPKTLTAAFVPVFLGSILSPTVDWGLTLFALLGALCIQIGTNLVNDALDFRRGADTEERLGPPRATQKGWLSPQQVLAGGAGFFFLSVLSAIPLIQKGGWPILIVLALSLICGYLYTGGPKPLAYNGLGEIFVFIFFGWAATGIMYYLQSGTISWEAVLAGTQIGLLCTLIIALNNYRDVDQDSRSGKRTLAVRYGRRFAKIEIGLLAFIPFLLNTLWLAQNRWLAGLIATLPLPLAVWIVLQVVQHERGRALNKPFTQSALLHLLFGTLLAAGLLFE